MCMLAYVSTRQACSCVFVLASSHALMHLCLLHLCIYAVSRCACTACTACTKYQSLHASSAHNRAPPHTCTRTPQLLSRKHWDTTPSACARLIRLLRLVCVHLCVRVRARVHAHTPQRTQRHTAHNGAARARTDSVFCNFAACFTSSSSGSSCSTASEIWHASDASEA